MAARVKFSSQDDDDLVQYLAEHAPVGGRGGNVLYKNLCNNEGNLWPWSKRHPWQSWRDHYCKDSGRFDAKIKSYLKRTHPASSNLTGVEKSQVRKVAKAPAPAPRAAETKKVALAQTAPAKASATIVKTKKPSVTARKSANETKPTEEGYDGEVPDSQSAVEEEDVKWDRSYENELFGSYASGESDEEVDEDAELTPEQHDSPASSPAPSPDADENIYPKIEDVPNPELERDPHPPGAFNTIPPNSGLRTPPSAKQGLTQPPKKLKRKIRDAEEDPFGDSSPPPASPVKKPAMPATNRRNPPVRVDGGFRTTLKTVTNSQNVSNWPPVRGAPQTQRKAEDVVMVEAESEAVILVPATQSQPKAAVRRPAQPQVNAVASSSKLKAPSERRPPQQPPQKRQRVENDPPPVRRPIVEPRPKPAPPPPPPQQPPAPSVHPAQPARHAPPPPRPAQPTQHAADVFSSRHHRQSTTHTEDAPRIDLRRSIHKGRVSSRRDSSLHSYSRRHSSISTSSAALDPTSARMMEHLNGEIEKLGPKFGFSFEVVRQTYLATASLDNTKVVLTFLLEWMRKGQEEIERRHPELFVHSYEHGPGAGSDGEAPEGLVPESHLQRQVLETRTREQNKLLEQSAKGSAKRPRASLNYKLLPPDVQDEVEWSPPNKTRAGEYARLTREGREDEAREREQRRLSGPYNKARDRELPRHRERTLEEQQIPPETYAPSLLQERQDTDEPMPLDEAKEEKFDPRNIDDIYASQEAETQEPLNQQAQPEEERVLEPTSAQPPPHQQQRQHAAASAPEERSHISISDDEDNTGRARDAENEAAPDVDPDPDRLHVLYEEHKRLTEQVRFDDDLSLKAFTALEKRLREEPDKLLLRRWSAARVQERVEAASRAQEWRLEEYTRKQEEERVKLEEMDRKRKKGV